MNSNAVQPGDNGLDCVFSSIIEAAPIFCIAKFFFTRHSADMQGTHKRHFDIWKMVSARKGIPEGMLYSRRMTAAAYSAPADARTSTVSLFLLIVLSFLRKLP